ncbi:MAG TPA: hypothetical protein PKC72_08330 [Chitinophagaceae bacterium]|nr:hypothetical protein [Chitinophagaceae bacterium]
MAVCIPFLGVPDMERAVIWYTDIGFSCTGSSRFWEPAKELTWAQLEWEGAPFMIFPSEKKHNGDVKDAGLYFKVINIDGLVDRLKQRARIIELTEEPFTGKVEVVFEDLNGFRVTFSCDGHR